MSLLATFRAIASQASSEASMSDAGDDRDDLLEQQVQAVQEEIDAKVKELADLQLRKEYFQNRLKRKRSRSTITVDSDSESSRGSRAPTPRDRHRRIPTADIHANPLFTQPSSSAHPIPAGSSAPQMSQKAAVAEFLTSEMIEQLRAAIPTARANGMPSPPITPSVPRIYGKASAIYIAPKGKWYVVFKGRQIGVYNDWGIASQHVDELKAADYRSYESENTARWVFEDASEKGMTRIIS